MNVDEKDKWLERNAERGGMKRNCCTVLFLYSVSLSQGEFV